MADVRFGPYRLESLIGRGGMGEVFRAFDTESERVVALKRLAPHLADDPEFRTRFRQEARLAARLRNPHIITIHRFGELDGHLFIDMRFVHGFDAADLIKAVGPLAPDRAVGLVEQVASALDTAHAAGLVHRDVKPSNLLLDREVGESLGDFVYLADFGITRATSTTRSYSLTRTGALLGSLDYMAPEQFDGVADKRVDIYALTCVLFELLTGQKPYQATGLPALMHAHVNIAPPRPSQFGDALDPAFDDVVRRGMAKQRDDRYGSAGELAAAARSALRASPAHQADGASRHFREAEYAYVTQRKLRERSDPSGRHVLDEHEPWPDPADDAPVATTVHDDAGAVDGSTDEGRPGGVSTSDDAEPPVEEAETDVLPTASVEPGTSAGSEPDPAALDTVPPAAADTVPAAAADTVPPAAAETVPSAAADTVPAAAADTVPAAAADTVPAAAADTVPSGVAGRVRPRPGVAHPAGATAVARGERWHGRALASVVAVVAALVLVVGLLVNRSGGDGSAADEAAPGDAVATAPAATSPTAPADPVVPRSTADPTVRAVVPVGSGPQGVAVSADNGRIFVANIDSRTLSVIHLASAASTTTVPLPGTPRYVGVAPDGRAFVGMYTGDGADSSVAVVAPDAASVAAVVPSGPQPYALAVGPTGDVFVPNHGTATVGILDADTLRFGGSVTVEPNPHGIAFSRSRNRAYTANHESNSVSVIDLDSRAVVATIPVGRSPHSVAVSTDGRVLAVANYLDGSVSFVDTSTDQVTATVPAGSTPQHLTFSVDGEHVYVVNEDADMISTIGVAHRGIVSTTPVGNSPRFVVATHDGTKLIVSNGDDGTVSFLNAS